MLTTTATNQSNTSANIATLMSVLSIPHIVVRSGSHVLLASDFILITFNVPFTLDVVQYMFGVRSAITGSLHWSFSMGLEDVTVGSLRGIIWSRFWNLL